MIVDEDTFRHPKCNYPSERSSQLVSYRFGIIGVEKTTWKNPGGTSSNLQERYAVRYKIGPKTCASWDARRQCRYARLLSCFNLIARHNVMRHIRGVSYHHIESLDGIVLRL